MLDVGPNRGRQVGTDRCRYGGLQYLARVVLDKRSEELPAFGGGGEEIAQEPSLFGGASPMIASAQSDKILREACRSGARSTGRSILRPGESRRSAEHQANKKAGGDEPEIDIREPS